jgi:hypothetical protein
MSTLRTLARMQAMELGRAVPAATVRHVPLAERRLVIVPLAAAGEAGAPLAALVGTERESPQLLTVPQPLDRDQRFAFLARLAEAVLPFLESAADEVEEIPGRETDPETGERREVVRELCTDAPQLVVPNPSAADFLGLLGRYTRFRRSEGEETAEAEGAPARYLAPPQVPLLGRWLTHYHERSQVPGSGLVLAVTDALSFHWATGQSSVEDQHLGALLGWIDPPPGLTGPQAASRAESARDASGLLLHPPAGPATDPYFDQRRLAPAVARYDAARSAGDQAATAARAAEIAELLRGVLLPTWEDVWRGLDLLRALPPAGHLGERWEGDRWSYTGHRDRVRAGEPPQPVRDDPVTAARKLAQRERDQYRLEVHQALDDPLEMAERRLAGEAFAGEVTEVEEQYDTSGRTPKPRPLVTVRTGDQPLFEPGTVVHRAGGPTTQRAELVEVESGGGGVLLRLRLLNGMGRRKEPEPGTVPEPGDQVCFTAFELAPRQSAPLPDPEETPWTHGGPPTPRPEEVLA